jgi:uncharacterized protein (TIGR03083 family)
MSPDPAEPQRLHDLVEAFAQTAQAVIDLARSCGHADLAHPTECPGWTVHDQISHVAGVEAWLAGHRDPRVEMPPYEHIRNELGKKVEFAVEARRGRSGAEVVAELERVLAQRLQTLRSPAMTGTSIVAGPFGPDEALKVVLLRTFDVWTHEQDIRSALGRPGDLDSAAAAAVVRSIMAQLPKVIARSAVLEPGHLVVIDVTGPVMARQGIQVGVDEQGRHLGHATSTDDSVQLSDPSVGRRTTISLSTEAFTRRAAGRRSVSDTPYRVVGDDAVARRVLDAFIVTP